jgi:hypothetical protein
MKKHFFSITFLLCSLLISNLSFSQYGIEVNYGLNGVFKPSINNFSHFGAGVTYDIDEIFGLKLDFGSDKFTSEKPLFTEKTGINATRISIQGTVNVSSLLDRTSLYSTFSLIAHAGGGYTMIKSSYNEGNDNIANVIMGLTPRIKISNGLYFAVDASLIFNLSQHYNFDGSFTYEGDAANSITGIMYNVTGGLVYKFNEYY